jgi:hypothetical protein
MTSIPSVEDPRESRTSPKMIKETEARQPPAIRFTIMGRL